MHLRPLQIKQSKRMTRSFEVLWQGKNTVCFNSLDSNNTKGHAKVYSMMHVMMPVTSMSNCRNKTDRLCVVMAHQWVHSSSTQCGECGWAQHTWMQQQKTDNWMERASSIPGTGLCTPTAASKHTHLKNTYCSNALQHQENHAHFIYRMTKWAVRAVRISWKRTHIPFLSMGS